MNDPSGRRAGFIGERGSTSRRQRSAGELRVGVFGLLGVGNIGNDASMESVLMYLKADHPDAIVDAMCPAPERLTSEYGIEASALYWRHKHEQQTSGVMAIALMALGRVIDAFRIASWVRRHEVVIVPGMGVLEASIPLRPWETPYAMFVLCASGRLFGTKVALVCVGAGAINKLATRWLLNWAARLAYYRSYRDTISRDAMSQRRLDTTQDPVYPDLVFGIPAPPCDPGDAQTVGIGVMAYYGTNDDRRLADVIYASYVEKIKSFAQWLVNSGRRIRLFAGDECDNDVLLGIMADLRAHRPDLDPSWVVAEPVSSFAELTRAMAPVGTVVATRFHNVVCALKLAKPVISLGYGLKNIALMADMAMSEFCQDAKSFDIDLLIKQFEELESRAAQLREVITERNATNVRLIERQFAELSVVLFPASEAGRTATESRAARAGAC
jgi:polysaccharide pyruvyl transferase WcaK-like protein